MVTRLDGGRKRSRKKMRKSTRQKGKISITRFFQEFAIGDKALLKAEPAYHNGMYNLRFHSKVGTIKGKKGSCYEVEISDGKSKTLIVHPIHLRKQ